MTAPFALDFTDSEVLAIDTATDTLRVRLSAAHVRRGDDGAAGYLPGVDIAVTGARWEGEIALGFGRVVAGRVRRDGVDVTLAIPLRVAGALSLELRFANGAQLAVAAATLDIGVDPAARFKEDFSC